MNRLTTTIAYVIAASTLLMSTSSFANGGKHFHGGEGYYWHHSGSGRYGHHPFWGPQVVFGLAAVSLTTAAIIRASQPRRIVYNNFYNTPYRIKTCYNNYHDGMQYCKIVTYYN